MEKYQMSKDDSLSKIKEECEFIISIFSKDKYQEILDDSILKRALIGSLHLIVRRLPRTNIRRKIEYYGSIDDMKMKLIRSIQYTEYQFNEKELYSFLEHKLPITLENVKKLL